MGYLGHYRKMHQWSNKWLPKSRSNPCKIESRQIKQAWNYAEIGGWWIERPPSRDWEKKVWIINEKNCHGREY